MRRPNAVTQPQKTADPRLVRNLVQPLLKLSERLWLSFLAKERKSCSKVTPHFPLFFFLLGSTLICNTFSLSSKQQEIVLRHYKGDIKLGYCCAWHIVSTCRVNERCVLVH